VGELTFQVPQVRSGDFYPSALEKGTRTDQAVNLALAEMYVQGVSTRRVIEVLQRLLGPEISLSTAQVSRAAAKLDEGLKAWRERPLGDVPYLFLDARYENLISTDLPLSGARPQISSQFGQLHGSDGTASQQDRSDD